MFSCSKGWIRCISNEVKFDIPNLVIHERYLGEINTLRDNQNVCVLVCWKVINNNHDLRSKTGWNYLVSNRLKILPLFILKVLSVKWKKKLRLFPTEKCLLFRKVFSPMNMHEFRVLRLVRVYSPVFLPKCFSPESKLALLYEYMLG